MKILLALCALLLTTLASAAGTSATVTLTLPTQYEDNSAIVAGDLANIVLEWRRVAPDPNYGGSSTDVGFVILAPVAQSYVVTGLNCGLWYFDAYANTALGQTGGTGWSSVYDTGIKCPNAPTNLTVK